ncbi:MAG: alpha/beta hydrolase-fold protein [Candidatus Sumerlaeia bacterium]|nr:alpha/beta hydrolase-fold protein [Candidatus Sumerlaeia bacterium]
MPNALSAMRRILLAALAAATACAAPAGPVVISVSQETQFGQSVFVSSPRLETGLGDITKSVKLSPHNYPVWSVTLDLPAGAQITPQFYLRSDAAADLGGAANGTLASTGSTLTAGAADDTPTTITIYPAQASDVALVTVISANGGGTVAQIPMTRNDANGLVRYEAQLPAVHARDRHMMQASVGGTLYPSDGYVRVNPAPTWWRFGQGFLYDPATMTAAPAAARTTTFTFQPTAVPGGGSAFGSRTIRVQLPRGYDAATKAYPVLYAQDGQNVFAPGGPFGSWDLDVAVRTLTNRAEMPEVILVGIDNTSGRFAEYTPEYGNISGTQGRGGEFLTMLRDQLLPEVESRYRVLQGPENTAHIGSSLGGLLGFHAANEFEDTWGSVVAMSPSFQVNSTENFRRALFAPAEFGRLYIDSGNTGTSADGYANTVTVRDRRLEAGEPLGERFWHTVGLGMQHNEAAWRQRSPDALRWLYSPALREASQPSAASGLLIF